MIELTPALMNASAGEMPNQRQADTVVAHLQPAFVAAVRVEGNAQADDALVAAGATVAEGIGDQFLRDQRQRLEMRRRSKSGGRAGQ